MKIQLTSLLVLIAVQNALSQNEPASAPKWRTTVQMGIQAGRVRPDPGYPNYGYYYYTVYSPVQRPTGNRIGLTIHATHSYIINTRAAVGVSTGVDYYNNSAFFPVAGIIQGDLLGSPHRISPFYSLESGYAFRGPNPHDKELTGGWLWSPGLGVRISRDNRTGFLISAGYKHQQARQTASVDGVQTLSQIEYRRYNRLYFRMGFSF